MLLAAVGLPSAVAAQTVVTNPTTLVFTPSADHDARLADGRLMVESYRFDVYAAGASQPFQSTNLGRPSPAADGQIYYDFSSSISAWPLPGGNYEARVAAVGPTGSGVSSVSNAFTFSSAAPSCAYTLSGTSASVPAAGGGTQVTVTTTSGCSWTATSAVSWLTLGSAGGTGTGTLVITVSPNTSTSGRTGTVAVAGQTFTVTQAGATAPPAGSSLPSPWQNRDVGSVGLSGSSSFASGVFTVNGSGSDIWGTADSFQFAYQSLAGDGQVVARVTGLQNTHPHAKAGLMLRSDLTANAAHVVLDVQPDNGIEFMERRSSGGSTTYLTGTTQARPAWLRLVRNGSTVTASVSADGLAWRTLGSTTVTMGSSVYAGLAVTSHTTGTRNTATFDNVTVGAAPVNTGGLPSPWVSQDIGSVGVAGTVSYSSGRFTVTAAGADVWGAADSFRYTYQPLAGDGTIVARVTSLQNTHPYAKAGVMLRAGLAANAAHVILDATPSGNVEFMTRTATGSSTTYLAGTSQPAPVWLRLARAGATVTASVSPDGVTWQTVGSMTVSMGASAYVGLAVTSHDTRTRTTATFDNVTAR